MTDIMSKKVKMAVGVVAGLFIVVILALVIGFDMRNSMEQQQLLEDSIKKQLMSITYAARDMLSADRINGYNTIDDVALDFEHFYATRENLRRLARETGADYIYVLKYVDGEAVFLLDTDEEDESVFVPYELSQVHVDAFNGIESAGVMNVEDEYGSYNTAAVPIYRNGKVVAIVSTDIEDLYLKQSHERASRSLFFLICAITLVLSAMAAMIIILLSRVEKMQKKLSDMARKDAVTGLPNRQFLIEYLQMKTAEGQESPFALFFIDLDNFKRVNDSAGHDAGDELLLQIAQFLERRSDSVRAFRPAPGMLNIAARIGGDEFILSVDGIKDAESAARMAKKLLDDFTNKREFSHYREKYGLGLSIGVSLYPKDTKNLHVLIKYSDIAMYHAKHGGKNDFRVYDEEMMAKQEK